jgi:glycerophosphoryl diester phosphodiesterase
VPEIATINGRNGSSMRPPLVIAHRGDPIGFRENTLPAFASGVRAGADMVEIDVRRTADGEVVVLHDATLRRLWRHPRRVTELTLAEVRRVSVDGFRIPNLREVLEAIEVPLMVDYVRTDVVEPALEVVVASDALGRVLFSGSNVAGHRRLRALAPEARIALTWNSAEHPPEVLLEELAPEFVNPDQRLVDADLVAAMHARGLAVSTWTVDARAEMERLLDLGVDAMITDRVRELVALLAERVPQLA